MNGLFKSKLFQLPIIKKPLLAIYYFLWKVLARCLSDRSFLSLKYRLTFKKKLNWDNPQTFSEKIQWLKIYGRKPIHKVMADKYLVKDYVKKEIGEQYVIPLLGVWNNENEIDFEKLPNQFVLKCNHNSGTGMVICKNKAELNIEQVKSGLHKGLQEDYFPNSREYAYKDIPRKIIAEKYMEDTETNELRDYKFFCFDGEPKALFIAAGRAQGEEHITFDFFDMEYNHLPFTNGHPNAKVLPKKPVCFEEMKSLAAQLSVGIPHVRVDFYEVDGRVFFGEFTFSHWGGLMPFDPEDWDYTFGSWIKLPN